MGRRFTLKPSQRLYLVTDRKNTCGRDLLFVVEEALRGGAGWIQLREKDLDGRELYNLALRLRELTERYDAGLIINDRLDIVLSVDADGIHLGHGGLPPCEVRRYLPEDRLIGVSTHSVEEALRAQREGADFITLGPVYPTPSKMKYGPPVGIKVLDEVCRRVSIPVFAIGGIRRDRIKEVMQRGAEGVALISAVMESRDVKRCVEGILKETGG